MVGQNVHNTAKHCLCVCVSASANRKQLNLIKWNYSMPTIDYYNTYYIDIAVRVLVRRLKGC